MSTETPCRADVDSPCDCPKCEAAWKAARDYWKPLYDGEKTAGLLSPDYPHDRTRKDQPNNKTNNPHALT